MKKGTVGMVVEDVLYWEVAHVHRCEWSLSNHVGIWEEGISGRGNYTCQGPEAGACAVGLRNREKTHVRG